MCVPKRLIFPENTARNPKPKCIILVWVAGVGVMLHKFRGWISHPRDSETLPLDKARGESTALSMISPGEKLRQLAAKIKASWQSGRRARPTHSLHLLLGSEFWTHLLTNMKGANCFCVEWVTGQLGVGHRLEELSSHNSRGNRVFGKVSWAWILVLCDLQQLS